MFIVVFSGLMLFNLLVGSVLLFKLFTHVRRALRGQGKPAP